jgi:uncharacterized protein YndB with AHSA1/START domain
VATVKVSRDIEAPVADVFARFTDIQHGPAHVSGIKDIQLLTPGGFSLGTRWLETRQVLGRRDSAEMEVTAFERNRGYTITHHKAGVRIDATFTFEPLPLGTRVTIEFALNEQGLPPGLLSPLEWAMAGRVRDALAQDLSDLKASIERLAPGA